MVIEFEVLAYRGQGAPESFRLTAGSLNEAQLKAEHQGYRVLSLQPIAGRQIELSARALSWMTPKFSTTLFCQELLVLLEAGLNVIEGIEVLSRKARDEVGKYVILQLLSRVREGITLSQALAEQPSVFSGLLVATVRASETTGNLQQAFVRYLAYQQQLKLVRDKVISAAVYPVMLLVVGSLVILFLLIYVIPRFAKVFADMGDRLPQLSRWLLSWGEFVQAHGAVLLLIAAVAIVSTVFLLMRKEVRALFVRWCWGLPVLGEHLRLHQLARLMQALGLLVQGGIPLVTALGMTQSLLQMPALNAQLLQAKQAIEAGQSTSAAFDQFGLCTEIGSRLLVVGERSGDLGGMMERIARIYDDEIARTVEWFTRLIEPVLMIVMGAIIGTIVLLMYFPIFELANSLQ